LPLGIAGRPRRQVIALDGGGEFRRLAENRFASVSSKPASRVASRKAALRSAALISACKVSGSFGGRPKRTWMAASSRLSTAL